uniref:Uncharacterized protein n=3 Tax=Juglanconis TaxID=1940564 RepID=A0A291LJ15_9PEZI|nr:hypothetical protein [Juglanconis oblonga]ATI20324.1 hypothetical protein [Juglanconis sp.]ATI20398.1 hypothetical protein [Juglanconis oblonga]ATI20504.1 hypothetical protein [Juglanconis juglandina]
MWYFQLIIGLTISLCMWILNGDIPLDQAALNGLAGCVDFLFWFIQRVINPAYLDDNARAILIPVLEFLRDIIREVASLLPPGHELIASIFRLSEAIANFLFDIGVR